jgi:ATP diphosphatase
MSEQSATPYNLTDLLDIVARLRDPQQGCPWDLAQTFSSLTPYTLEETYEVIDAIEQQDYQALAGELGDLLLQLVLYAQLGREQGYFDFNQVVDKLVKKLIRRHPHVFSNGGLTDTANNSLTAQQAADQWQQIKQQEQSAQQSTSVLDGLPRVLPALLRAQKLQQRAAQAGFDWQNIAQIVAQLDEEVAEFKEALASQDAAAISDELGDLLFTGVNLIRYLGLNAEQVMAQANKKFNQRFRRLENNLANNQQKPADLSWDELITRWQQAKAQV